VSILVTGGPGLLGRHTLAYTLESALAEYVAWLQTHER
jgi:uncharacterized protein YbjT (DUF2867 family)